MKEQHKQLEKVMTVQEVSAYLKIPVSTLYDLTRKGKLRGGKVGRQWRYLETDVVGFLHGISRPDGVPVTLERRQYPRIKILIPAKLTTFSVAAGESEKEGVLRNLGEKGILFEEPNGRKGNDEDEKGIDELETGNPVRITFEIPGSDSPLVVEGRIIHQTKNPSLKVGIRFRQISNNEQRILRDYVG